MKRGEGGEVEKVVGNRARVTASNNVFSPLCVLAARERAEGIGSEQAISILARVATPRGTALAYTPSAINFVNTACCGRDIREEKEREEKKGMKRGSLSRPRQPLALFVFSFPVLTVLREGPLMDFYVRTMARFQCHRDLLFPTLARVLIKGIM